MRALFASSKLTFFSQPVFLLFNLEGELNIVIKSQVLTGKLYLQIPFFFPQNSCPLPGTSE